MKFGRITRIAVLAGVGAVALAAALPAAADGPVPIRIETHGVFTGPDSVAGAFTISGAVSDEGSFVESLRFAGTTVHGVKTLVGREGTVTLEAHAVVRWASPTRATLFAGHWRFVSGTGAYAGLLAGGHPAVKGSADLAAGTVDAVHDGSAHGPHGS